MAEALSTIVAGAFVVAVAYALAYCLPTKEMLDAEAVEREWSPPAAAQCTSKTAGSATETDGGTTR